MLDNPEPAPGLRQRLNEILRADPLTCSSLKLARSLDLPDCFIASGAIYQSVWNALTDKPSGYGLKDVDLIYFDGNDLSWEGEDRIIKRASAAFEAADPIPSCGYNDPWRRLPKIFGQERSALRCGASRGGRDAVQKSWEAAVAVADAALRRASESLADAPHRLRLSSFPKDCISNLHGSLSPQFGISVPAETRNQARVHLWFEQRFGSPYAPLGNASESLTRYASTTHAVGVRLEGNDSLSIEAPFGLEDIFNLTLRPNPALENKGTYDEKAARCVALWPQVSVIPWT